MILGAASVGKTAILKSRVKTLANGDKPTIGMEYVKIPFEENNQFALGMWDTSGAEMYRSVIAKLMPRVQLGLLVYDITDADSLEDLKWYADELKKRAGNIPTIVVENKADLIEKRKVDREKGEAFAKEIGAVGFQESNNHQ